MFKKLLLLLSLTVSTNVMAALALPGGTGKALMQLPSYALNAAVDIVRKLGGMVGMGTVVSTQTSEALLQSVTTLADSAASNSSEAATNEFLQILAIDPALRTEAQEMKAYEYLMGSTGGTEKIGSGVKNTDGSVSALVDYQCDEIPSGVNGETMLNPLYKTVDVDLVNVSGDVVFDGKFDYVSAKRNLGYIERLLQENGVKVAEGSLSDVDVADYITWYAAWGLVADDIAKKTPGSLGEAMLKFWTSAEGNLQVLDAHHSYRMMTDFANAAEAETRALVNMLNEVTAVNPMVATRPSSFAGKLAMKVNEAKELAKSGTEAAKLHLAEMERSYAALKLNACYFNTYAFP